MGGERGRNYLELALEIKTLPVYFDFRFMYIGLCKSRANLKRKNKQNKDYIFYEIKFLKNQFSSHFFIFFLSLKQNQNQDARMIATPFANHSRIYTSTTQV